MLSGNIILMYSCDQNQRLDVMHGVTSITNYLINTLVILKKILLLNLSPISMNAIKLIKNNFEEKTILVDRSRLSFLDYFDLYSKNIVELETTSEEYNDLHEELTRGILNNFSEKYLINKKDQILKLWNNSDSSNDPATKRLNFFKKELNVEEDITEAGEFLEEEVLNELDFTNNNPELTGITEKGGLIIKKKPDEPESDPLQVILNEKLSLDDITNKTGIPIEKLRKSEKEYEELTGKKREIKSNRQDNLLNNPQIQINYLETPNQHLENHSPNTLSPNPKGINFYQPFNFLPTNSLIAPPTLLIQNNYAFHDSSNFNTFKCYSDSINNSSVASISQDITSNDITPNNPFNNYEFTLIRPENYSFIAEIYLCNHSNPLLNNFLKKDEAKNSTLFNMRNVFRDLLINFFIDEDGDLEEEKTELEINEIQPYLTKKEEVISFYDKASEGFKGIFTKEDSTIKINKEIKNTVYTKIDSLNGLLYELKHACIERLGRYSNQN